MAASKLSAYEYGVGLRMGWHYDDSIRVTGTELEHATGEAAAWLHRSQAENYLQTNRLDEALAELDKVDSSFLHGEFRKRYVLTAARCHRYGGEYDKAIELLQEPGLRSAQFLMVECLVEIRPYEALDVLDSIELKTPLNQRRYYVGKLEAFRALGQPVYTDLPLVHGDIANEMLNVRQLLCKAVVHHTWQEVIDYTTSIGWESTGYTQTICRAMMGHVGDLPTTGFHMPLMGKLVEQIRLRRSNEDYFKRMSSGTRCGGVYDL